MSKFGSEESAESNKRATRVLRDYVTTMAAHFNDRSELAASTRGELNTHSKTLAFRYIIA